MERKRVAISCPIAIIVHSLYSPNIQLSPMNAHICLSSLTPFFENQAYCSYFLNGGGFCLDGEHEQSSSSDSYYRRGVAVLITFISMIGSKRVKVCDKSNSDNQGSKVDREQSS